ncbi:uncharacterized protein LOC135715607 [Ochlerotatus camptorhynchus]|uniref:uncharacterized protein LOC135707099 n=1 Tax=Ochlerotatus camptorhynchus TaxID=644619 RepID=UPI0031CF2C2F
MPKQKWTTSGKQYCAEPEHDPYELLYRKSDIFYEYLNDAPCKVPNVEEHLADPMELLETIDSIDLPAHRLTGKVRLQYLNFLEKLLENNYDAWSSTVEPYESVTFTPDEVKRCAASIEMKAVQSCMIMSLYRNYVLKLISQIRKETKEVSLHPTLINMKFTPKIIKKECSHVAVQTDPYEEPYSIQANMVNFLESNDLPLLDVPAMSLDEKIRNFERKMQLTSPELRAKKSKREKSRRKERSRSRNRDRSSSHMERKDNSCYSLHHEGEDNLKDQQRKPIDTLMSPITKLPEPGNDGAQDDQIMRELEAMFETGDNGNIFDSCENQVQINAIINEIEKFEPTNACEHSSSTRKPPNQQILEVQQEILELQSPKYDFDDAHTGLLVSKEYSKLGSSEEKKADLKKSLWPCELHMQKTKLRELLSNIADMNYLRYERIRARFVIFFGEYEEEEDELGPYSPSIELNEILVSSCRQRIAKWVVQALMKPLNDGLIANRFLFKRLAKHVADNIIYLNQYPDQRFIKNYVVDYFCTHTFISSVEDMN